MSRKVCSMRCPVKCFAWSVLWSLLPEVPCEVCCSRCPVKREWMCFGRCPAKWILSVLHLSCEMEMKTVIVGSDREVCWRRCGREKWKRHVLLEVLYEVKVKCIARQALWFVSWRLEPRQPTKNYIRGENELQSASRLLAAQVTYCLTTCFSTLKIFHIKTATATLCQSTSNKDYFSTSYFVEYTSFFQHLIFDRI